MSCSIKKSEELLLQHKNERFEESMFGNFLNYNLLILYFHTHSPSPFRVPIKWFILKPSEPRMIEQSFTLLSDGFPKRLSEPPPTSFIPSNINSWSPFYGCELKSLASQLIVNSANVNRDISYYRHNLN